MAKDVQSDLPLFAGAAFFFSSIRARTKPLRVLGAWQQGRHLFQGLSLQQPLPG
tara:strand:+ start:59945 stop:60106 length:162 start_codon:yes stop_codon:yes gene_type:complete